MPFKLQKALRLFSKIRTTPMILVNDTFLYKCFKNFLTINGKKKEYGVLVPPYPLGNNYMNPKEVQMNKQPRWRTHHE